MPCVRPPRSSKHPIMAQQLLYPQRPQRYTDKDPPSYAAAQRSTSNIMPTPGLIDELFNISVSVLDKLGGPRRGTSRDPKLMIQRNASWWSGNIEVYRMHYTEVKDGVCIKYVMERGGCDHLYAEMFWYLAEAIFHACEFPIRASTLTTGNISNNSS